MSEKATTTRTHSSYALDSISNVLSPNYQSYNVEEDGRQSMVTFKSAFVMKTASVAQESAPASHNSRIVDYFKHLEMKRAVKKKTNMPLMATTRTINEKKAAAAAANQNPPVIVVSTDEEIIPTRVIKESGSNAEIERIQDELFDDGLTHDLTPKPPTPCRSLLHTTSSPLSVISVSSFASSSPAHSTSQLEFKGASDLSENPFMNRSIEKIRRSVSSPKIIVNVRF